MTKAVQGTARGGAAKAIATGVEPATLPGKRRRAPAPTAPTPAEITNPKRLFSKPYAIDSLLQFGSHLAIRLWAVDATDFIRIVVRSKGVASRDTIVSTLFYPRRDIDKYPDARVFGLTIFLSDPAILQSDNVEVLLVSRNDEVLVVQGRISRSNYAEFFGAVVYDMQRTGRPIEQRLLFDRTLALPKLLQSSWQHYLSSEKQAFTSFGHSYRPASYSIVTVFYRRSFLAGLYAFTASVLDTPPEAEIILCFQQAAAFQQQIDYLEGLFRLFQINHKIILFEDNVGFAAANNIAVEQSSSPRILLVNPDICCSEPEIYGRIAEAADDGAIYGATLLSDADEVMHNGIEFIDQTVTFKSRALRVLRTSHIGRHGPVELIEEGQIDTVEAVSGALFAVSRATWDRIGGLPEHFVFAHFEDVEMCRKAAQLGIDVKVYNTRKLVHLESYGSGEDSMLGAIKQINSAIFNMGTP